MRAVVLGADSKYMDKVETVIKSVSSYNDEVRFYILNDDFPTEWFQLMNKRLSVLQSEVLNIKITMDFIKDFHTPNPHINYAAYFRYFIPNFVKEEKALYLDSDTIVNGSLENLFTFDLEDFPLAAVPDIPESEETFNSGVLLINVEKWKDQNITKQLLDLTAEHHEHVYGDQEILNMLFQSNYKKLDLTYNLQVGADAHRFYYGDLGWYNHFITPPVIIHYTTVNKPWSHYRFNRFRDLWWFYYGLNWNDILTRSYLLQEGFNNLIQPIKKHATIFTNSGDIEELAYLLEKLPEIQFHIAAPTYFSPNIVELQRYQNLYIYPCVDPAIRRQLIKLTDIYLDINYGPGWDEMLQAMLANNKRIYSFENTNHFASGDSIVYAPTDVEKLVQELKKGLDR